MFAIREIFLSRSAKTWPKTLGVVTRSEMEFKGQTSEANLRFNYEYTVDGKTYKGSRIIFGGRFSFSFNSFSTDNKYLSQYPVGSEVEVIYSPIRPSISGLQLGSPKPAITMLIIGIFMLLGFIVYSL
jgi:hypothetical protein